jgi:hypothetical protein
MAGVAESRTDAFQDRVCAALESIVSEASPLVRATGGEAAVNTAILRN